MQNLNCNSNALKICLRCIHFFAFICFFSKNVLSDKKAYGIFKGVVSFAIEIVMLLWLSPYMWTVCVDYIGAENEIKCSLLWTLVLHVIQFPMIGFSFYEDFVIEEKHGFNKKTYALFFTDLVKGEAIA